MITASQPVEGNQTEETFGWPQTRKDQWGRHEVWTARGRCNWCAQPFLRRQETKHGCERLPVLHCKPACSKAVTKKRKQIRDHARLCPTPDKLTFLTEAVATAEAADRPSVAGLRVAACLSLHGRLPRLASHEIGRTPVTAREVAVSASVYSSKRRSWRLCVTCGSRACLYRWGWQCNSCGTIRDSIAARSLVDTEDAETEQ